MHLFHSPFVSIYFFLCLSIFVHAIVYFLLHSMSPTAPIRRYSYFWDHPNPHRTTNFSPCFSSPHPITPGIASGSALGFPSGPPSFNPTGYKVMAIWWTSSMDLKYWFYGLFTMMVFFPIGNRKIIINNWKNEFFFPIKSILYNNETYLVFSYVF